MRPRISADGLERLRLRILWTVGLTATVQVFTGYNQPAQANGFSDWSCHNIPFADKVCATVEATNRGVNFLGDPMGYIAQFINNAVTSLFTEMIKELLSTTTIDWGDDGFIRTYAMAFAASSVLTVILWLIAVAKRAIQGVDPLQAVTESIGYLLVSVIVSALAPAAIAYTTELFDQAAAAMLAPAVGDAASMVVTVTTAMAVIMSIPGGDVLVMFLGLGMLSAVAGVWMEMVIRNALILAGLVFGTSVFSGLVDRDLWRHVRRWVGVMGAVIASKYVTFTTIALATGMLASDSEKPSVGQAFATVFTAIALMWLALFLPFQISKFLPLMGDEIAGMYQARDEAKGRAKAMGSAAGDTFRELASRFGGGSSRGGGADGGGEEEGSEAGAEEAGAAATGAGAAAIAAKTDKGAANGTAQDSAASGAEAAGGNGGSEHSEGPDTRSSGAEQATESHPGGATAHGDGGTGDGPAGSPAAPSAGGAPGSAPDASSATPDSSNGAAGADGLGAP